MKRAAVCIGVGKALPAVLKGAAPEARRFAQWAQAQGCQTTIFTDDGQDRVRLSQIFDAVRAIVERGAQQLIVYFAGHGVQTEAFSQKWLLSDARGNENEGVNLVRSIDLARRSGIPHVVFVSDACRTSTTYPLQGGNIFPNPIVPGRVTEVDVFYATRSGDPTVEVTVGRDTVGIFTDVLLRTVMNPDDSLVDTVAEGGRVTLRVVTSHSLKPYLEKTVPIVAGAIHVQLSGLVPEVLAEAALPKFFAEVKGTSGAQRDPTPPPPPPGTPEHPTILDALDELSDAARDHRNPNPSFDAARRFRLDQDIDALIAIQRQAVFDADVGISVHGAVPRRVMARRWDAAEPVQGESGFHHVRLTRRHWRDEPDTAVVEFAGGGGTIVAIVPHYICAIAVRDERVISVQYAPAPSSPIAEEYRDLADDIDRLRATVAVAALNGRFVVPATHASEIAGRIREHKAFDPTLGLYAAYAYASVGRYDDVRSVLQYMRDEPPHFVPFDVLMLSAANPDGDHPENPASTIDPATVAPGVPMLAPGWSVLDEENPLWVRDLHGKIRRQLTPSLWTTLSSSGGISVALDELFATADA